MMLYNTIHPHKALGYRSPREFRKQLVEETTENAVGAVRRPHDSPMSTDALGSRPSAAPSAVAPAPALTRAQLWTNRKNESLSGYSGATTDLTICNEQHRNARFAMKCHSDKEGSHTDPICSIHKSFVKLTQLPRAVIEAAIIEESAQPRLCVRVHYVMLKSRECSL